MESGAERFQDIYTRAEKQDMFRDLYFTDKTTC